MSAVARRTNRGRLKDEPGEPAPKGKAQGKRTMKVKGTSDTPNIPPASLGLHRGVCCEVYDRGLVDTKHGRKHKGWFVFQVEELIDLEGTDYHGKRKEVRVPFNLTLGKKSTLRQVLESWRGQALSAEEIADGFDLDVVVGVSALLNVGSHSEPDEGGRQYANVATVLPPVGKDGRKGDAWSIKPLDYVPLAERGSRDDEPDDEAPASGPPSGGKVPF